MATKSDLSNLIGTKDITAYFKQFLPTPKSDDKYFRTINHKNDYWSTVTIGGSTNTAAGIISNDASAPILSRPEMKSVIGGMVTIGGGFNMSAKDIQEFQGLKQAFASSGSAGDATALLDFYGNDLSKCRSIIQNEKNYLNWSLLSNACNIDITLANSTYAKSMTTTSYPVSSWQKDAVGTAWSNTASLILDDIAEVFEAGKNKQKKYSKMFVNYTTYGYIRKNKQIQDNCASRISVALGTVGMPSNDTINMLLNEMFGIELIVISDLVDRESVAGIITTVPVFADNVAVFTESAEVGHWGYNDIAIIRPDLEVREGYYIVGNVLEVNPSKSTTYSKAQGFSVVDSYASNFYLKVDANNWA